MTIVIVIHEYDNIFIFIRGRWGQVNDLQKSWALGQPTDKQLFDLLQSRMGGREMKILSLIVSAFVLYKDENCAPRAAS